MSRDQEISLNHVMELLKKHKRTRNNLYTVIFLNDSNTNDNVLDDFISSLKTGQRLCRE